MPVKTLDMVVRCSVVSLSLSHLLDVAPGYVEEGEQELELDLGLQVREAVLDVAQHLGVQLGADRAAGPAVVGRAELVVQPEGRVAVAHVRHGSGFF